MKPIPISSCYICDPNKWKTTGKSEVDYKCEKCGKIINKILRRKDE